MSASGIDPVVGCAIRASCRSDRSWWSSERPEGVWGAVEHSEC